ncbi:MAG: hypothetical protein OXD01_14815 [Gammaproteobacteria bacterium]|nr:hypothetical protein [Gammaproteobacteria bacterium]
MKEDWAWTEECLLHVAGSMGQLLRQIRSHVSKRMLDGAAWERMLARADEVPPTYAAFPFGFEFPLQNSEPRADLGLSLVGDSRTAAIYQDNNCTGTDDPTVARLAWILNETDRERSLLRRVVGRKMLLEYDIETGPDDEYSEPGIFLYPIDDVLAGARAHLEELRAVYDALVQVGNWQSDAAERQQLEQVYGALPPDKLLRALGTFPSRERTIRIAITPFHRAKEVATFLDRMGWPGDSSMVATTIEPFEAQKAYAYMGVHFDINANGVGAQLGLSFFAQEKEWLKDITHWTGIIEVMDELGCALPEKLAELTRWSTGSSTLIGKTGPIMLVRGIHHIKLVFGMDSIEQAKAYTFFLMMSAPKTAQ